MEIVRNFFEYSSATSSYTAFSLFTVVFLLAGYSAIAGMQYFFQKLLPKK